MALGEGECRGEHAGELRSWWSYTNATPARDPAEIQTHSGEAWQSLGECPVNDLYDDPNRSDIGKSVIGLTRSAPQPVVDAGSRMRGGCSRRWIRRCRMATHHNPIKTMRMLSPERREARREAIRSSHRICSRVREER